MTTTKTETRFQSQIRSFNKMYKLDCEQSPRLPHGYQNAARRISDFMSILQEEIEEGTAIVDRLQSVAPIQEVLAQIADWLGDIQVYCASEMRKFGLDNDATLGIIMASNFSKLDEDGEPIYDARGKVLKGVNFFPPEPELRELIGHQMLEAAKQQIVE